MGKECSILVLRYKMKWKKLKEENEMLSPGDVIVTRNLFAKSPNERSAPHNNTQLISNK
jgi:hypothetical protein